MKKNSDGICLFFRDIKRHVPVIFFVFVIIYIRIGILRKRLCYEGDK